MVAPTANRQSPSTVQAAAQAEAWLAARCAAVAAGDDTELAIAFGQAGRRHPDPAAARLQLVLAIPSGDMPRWSAQLDRLFATAGFEELVTLYRGLPLLPHPEALRLRAAAGVRSTMQPVFEAVALDNPYPLRWLDEEPVNQLVLKAFFLGCDHRRVVGLPQRANPALGVMLAGYRRERVAAARPVPAGLDEVVAWCSTPRQPPSAS